MPLEKCDQPPIKSRRYQRLASRLPLAGLQADVSDSEKARSPGSPVRVIFVLRVMKWRSSCWSEASAELESYSCHNQVMSETAMFTPVIRTQLLPCRFD